MKNTDTRRHRKTVEVVELLYRANTFMERSFDDQVQARKAIQSFTDSFLMSTRNYKGFGYLSAYMKFETDPETGKQMAVVSDESRVFFYVADKLKADYTAYAQMKQREEQGI